MASATTLFRFMEETPVCDVIRHEVSCASFAAVRSGLARLIETIGADDSGGAIADRLRYQLLDWLTSPADFRLSDTALLDQCGTPDTVRRQWGDVAGAALQQCRAAIQALQKQESPLRGVLKTILAEQIGAGRNVRVYCHRSAVGLFESLLGPDLQNALKPAFLHTARDYRLTDPFDVLVRVGPLRGRGFSALPPATLNAPRQRTLIQLVWAGLRDESEFGADPVQVRLRPFHGTEVDREVRATQPNEFLARSITISHGNAADRFAESLIVDELEFFAQRRVATDLRAALLVHFGNGMATLLTPGAAVLAYRKLGAVWDAATLPAWQLASGVYLIRADVGDTDLGDALSRDGRHSRQWKELLTEEARSSMTRLIDRLRAGGLDLVHLRNGIEHWRQPATTVIHAPQQREHFRIMIKVLGIEDDHEAFPRPAGAPWWKLAWREIQRSRGEAIQAGMQEQEIVDEELLGSLGALGSPQSLETGAAEVVLTLPLGRSLSGRIICHRVDAIEDGFRVPESVLRSIITPQEAYQWRD